jgi:hypothetical protein
MDLIQPHSNNYTSRFVRWLSLSIILVTCAALLAWWQRLFSVKQATVSLPDMPDVAPLSPQEIAAVPPRLQVNPPPRTIARYLLYLAIGVPLVWLAVNMPVSYLGLALIIVVAMAHQRAFVLTAGAVGLMISSAVSFRAVIYFEDIGIPVMVMLFAGAILWVSMQLHVQRIHSLPLPISGQRLLASTRYAQLHVSMFILGLIALVELIRNNTNPEAISASLDTQHGLLAIGIILIVAGLGGVQLPRRLLTIDWKMALAITLIVTLALVMRFWQLATTNRFFIDELLFSDTIRALWHSRFVSLTIPFDGIAAEPPLFPYWQSLAVDVFGRNFLGLRAVSAIFGTLTVGAVYILGRALFDRKTALCAALLLATFPPHIHFSRIGLSEIAMTFFGTLALAFLARGVIGNRRLDYAVGGAMLGMTHYFHEGGKYLYTPLAALWLVGIVLFFRSRLSLKNILVAGLACLLVALPIYAGLLLANKPLAARMVANSAGLSGEYWQQLFASGSYGQHIKDHVIPPFLMYVQHPDTTMFYGVNSPLMVTAVPAFLLGVFYLLRRWRTPGSMLLLLWVVCTSLGNSLLVQSAAAPRYVVAFPALMLLAAVGIRYILPLIWPEEASITFPNHWRFPAHRWFSRRVAINTLAIITLLAILSVIRVNYYFNEHIPKYNEQFRNSWGHRDAEDVVLRSLDFPSGTQIHIFSRTDPPDYGFTSGVLAFMVDGLGLHIPQRTTVISKYVESLDPAVNHAFFVGPYNTSVITVLREHFDLMPPQVSPYEDLHSDHQYILYFAPGQTAPAASVAGS